MQFLITPRRNKGKALPMVPPKRTTVIRGELTITNRACEHLHRHSNVATVRPIHGEFKLLLPELYDANLSAMAREGFTLSGIQLEEDVWYAQSWWCRPVD
ncbi:hypothetical protein [Pseudomonas abietaniphila]|uniref:hypothetical protein n=1 Tax=Pseudomonas abietaniphila TaxID=89065 RepID=UPI000781B67B|nr:hypothetical protein [Pseudomonas abietaniphila]